MDYAKEELLGGGERTFERVLVRKDTVTCVDGVVSRYPATLMRPGRR
jgi:hypothetical protein